LSVAAPPPRWTSAERAAELAAAEREGLDLLVIGGGITGAGVLRDAAARGLRGLLVERGDFASGTSGRSSKLVHGGLRYVGEGQLGTTREACRERDRLLRHDPNLIEPLPFLFPAHRGGRIPLWQVRCALLVYAGLANFRRTARFRMLTAAETLRLVPGLRSEGLSGAGLYADARVDDARLVIETLKSARALGGAAVSRAELESLRLDTGGAVCGANVRDGASGRSFALRAPVVVNAAGPAVEMVRALRRPLPARELRPAKGVHLVVPRARLDLPLAVTFEAADGRQVFATPWDDVVLIGTTDTWCEQIETPVVTIDEVHYLLAAANTAFPDAGLTTNDLCSVFAGVRPLASDPERDGEAPPSSHSREDRIRRDGGLISVMGGKLTTYRAMAERIVDRAVRALPRERRRALRPCRTRELPLRGDDFDAAELGARLGERYGLDPLRRGHLIRQYGAQAETLMAEAPPDWRGPIGRSRFSYAEIPWCLASECAQDLRDLLERRMRMALYAPGQGLPQLARIAEVAASAAGWDAERARAEARAYAAAVREQYQISATPAARSAA
jgi:glycerol-3-phosphate dehydrogenase